MLLRNFVGKNIFCLLLLASTSLFAKTIHIEKITPGKFLTITNAKEANAVIVVPPKAGKVLLFAAEELRFALNKATNIDIKIVNKAVSNKVNIFLGEEFLSQVKLSLDKVPIDGFIITSKNNNIYIAGRDSKTGDPIKEAGSWCKWERGSLYGVYHFLERFLGVRFYFPGAIGTIIPKNTKLTIPQMHIVEAPDFKTRKFISGVRPIPGRPSVSQWYEGSQKERNDVIKKDGLNRYRLRMSTYSYMAIHGLAQLGYVHRFGKSNPQFFALTDKNERYNQPRLGWDTKNHAGINGQLCLSNPQLRDQIYHDAKAYLTGKSAAAAGIDLGPKNGNVRWPGFLVPGHFDIMPNDSFYQCKCHNCQVDFKKGPQGVSDHVWSFAKDIALRAKKEKIPGKFNMMAYNPYRLIPSFNLPDNLYITLAAVGPWTLGTKRGQHDLELIKAWYKKCGTKIGALWTYPGDPYREFANLPMMTPKVVGRYFKELSSYLEGAFFEGETDHYIFQYLNFYIFSKVAWNNSVNVDAMLKEHFILMFGPAANSMKEAYDILERCWLKIYEPAGQQLTNKVDYPNEIERWTKIYDEKVMERISRLIRWSKKLTSKDKAFLERVIFMEKELFNPMIKAREAWVKNRSLVSDWSETIPFLKGNLKPAIDGKIENNIWRNAVTVPFQEMPVKNSNLKDNSRTIKLLRDDKYLYVGFQFTTLLSSLKFAKGNGKQFWFDTSAEVMLMVNPSTMYQFACNPAGEIRSNIYKIDKLKLTLQGAFSSSVMVKTYSEPKLWSCEFAIPLELLKDCNNEVKANFSYTESLKTGEVKHFTWSPYIKKSFQEFENFGTLNLVEKNLIRNGNFRLPLKNNKIPFWNANKNGIFNLDSANARFNSLSLKGTISQAGRYYCAQQIVNLKPNTQYVLSFFVKMDNLKRITSGRGGAYATIYYGKQIMVPKNPLAGSCPWTKVVYKFTTDAKLPANRCSLTIGVFDVIGTIYFDSIKLEEAK